MYLIKEIEKKLRHLSTGMPPPWPMEFNWGCLWEHIYKLGCFTCGCSITEDHVFSSLSNTAVFTSSGRGSFMICLLTVCHRLNHTHTLCAHGCWVVKRSPCLGDLTLQHSLTSSSSYLLPTLSSTMCPGSFRDWYPCPTWGSVLHSHLNSQHLTIHGSSNIHCPLGKQASLTTADGSTNLCGHSPLFRRRVWEAHHPQLVKQQQ